jgi:hypothetical protein
MKKRIFSLLLVFVLVLLCIAVSGCEEPLEGQNSSLAESSAQNESDDNSEESESRGRFYGLEIPESLDFGGKTVKVLTTGTAASPTTHQIQPNNNPQYSAENTTAVLTTCEECTRLVEQELGIEVEEEMIYTWSRYGGDMYKRIKTDAMSGTGDYLFAMPCSIEASMLSIDGLLHDLKTVPNIDLSREWWCREFNEGVTVDGSTYFAISDIGTVSKQATLFVAFNKKMADSYKLTEKYGYSSLYEMVDAKAWTQDVMFEMAKSVYQDVNGNNVRDLGDINGLAGQDGAVYNFLTAAGEKIISIENGFPKLTVYNERAINIITNAQEYLQDPKGGFISANDYFDKSQVPVRDAIIPEFKADRLLFFMDAIMNLDLIRDMESDFGVLPTPLYDEYQDGYSSQIGCWSTNCIVIPNFVEGENLELSGYFIEALSAVSNKKLNPVYYNQTLQYQISRDDDSMRMLDIIFDTRTCELAEIYHLGIYDTVCGMLKKPIGTFASEYDSIDELTNEAIEKIVDSYKSQK